jgi:hypothetical protein
MDFVIFVALAGAGVYYVGTKKGWWAGFGWPKGPDAE